MRIENREENLNTYYWFCSVNSSFFVIANRRTLSAAHMVLGLVRVHILRTRISDSLSRVGAQYEYEHRRSVTFYLGGGGLKIILKV